MVRSPTKLSVSNVPGTFQNSVQKLIDLDLSWFTFVMFLGQVVGHKTTRDARAKADEAIEDYSLQRIMRADVFKVTHTLHKSTEFQSLDSLGGMKAYEKKRSKLSIRFQQNLSEETIEFMFKLDEFKGLSESFTAALEKSCTGNYKVRYPLISS